MGVFTMDCMHHQGQRGLQDAFDTRRLADKLQEKIVRDCLNRKQKAFIENADMYQATGGSPDGKTTSA